MRARLVTIVVFRSAKARVLSRSERRLCLRLRRVSIAQLITVAFAVVATVARPWLELCVHALTSVATTFILRAILRVRSGKFGKLSFSRSLAVYYRLVKADFAQKEKVLCLKIFLILTQHRVR